ncbi:hypothetical protein HDU98_001521 [Podochytrium sp. JEL0797]|nr:hypothetical protein HDU98_001521 [Podochytrium sp. JEL0797]
MIARLHMIQPFSEFETTYPSKRQIRSMFSDLRELDPYFPLDRLFDKLVVSTTTHEGRLLASDAFRYASSNLKQDAAKPHLLKVGILANQDIYFDESLHLIATSPYSDLGQFTSYFLSRYEEPHAEESSLIGTQCGEKFVGSHDAFVFVPPLPEKLIQKCEFELGSWGIEARILWEFEQFGITGRNPCHDIKIWHVHDGGVKEQTPLSNSDNDMRRGPMPEVNVDGKSSIAFPDTLKTKFKKVVDELWGANMIEKQRE